MIQHARATVEDLLREPGKAELVGGRIVRFMSTGFWPTWIALKILLSLNEYCKLHKHGMALPDGLGFAVPTLSSGRESFSPDVSFYTGPVPQNKMRFIEGVPALAVEVRSENDYGSDALREMAEKRADYFEAGTLVVWDVDPIAECVHVYRRESPLTPDTYLKGQTAEAEPAVPKWTLSVDELFKAVS